MKNEQEQRQEELSKMSILTVEQRDDVLETSDNEDPCTLKKKENIMKYCKHRTPPVTQ